MKRLFFRHPLLALAVLAVLFTYNYCEEHKKTSTSKTALNKERSTSNDSSDEEVWQKCVSIDGEKEPYCFEPPYIGGYDQVSLYSQNKEIAILYGSLGRPHYIEAKCKFDKTTRKLILKNIMGIFPERHDPYGLDDVCRIDEINKVIDDIDVDSLSDRLTKEPNCRYEYSGLPSLQKLSEDFAETTEDDWLLDYRSGDYIKRYDAIFRIYPISNANHAIYNNIGYYLEQAKAYEAAIYLLNAVLEKYPQRAVAHLNIADAYWGNGEREEARKHYEEYVSLMRIQKKDESKIPQTVYDRMKPPPSLTDRRDGQQYRIVEIGKYTWMAENLNYRPSSGGSLCYGDSVDNCTKYGRLYDWNTALTACPSGWHLPSRQEWNNLGQTVGNVRVAYDETGIIEWSGADKTLKSKHGWKDYYGKNGNGTDDYGFSALPGGRYDSHESSDYVGYFYHIGDFGLWWTATMVDIDNAYARGLYNNADYMGEEYNNKKHAISVRCVQN